MSLPDLLAAARGDVPADLLLANGRVLNVFSGEIECADVAIIGERIVGLGEGYQAKQTIDLNGAYVAPGLIDAHVHIESSLCLPAQFATAVVPRGVTTAVIDPHEIANVCGYDGVKFMYETSRGLPLRVVVMAPSCVPATAMATSGAALSPADLKRLRDDRIVHGLAEVMNFPGVIHGDTEMLAKIVAFEGKPRDGHCPGISGRLLNAYVIAGIGSDHECISVAEAKEKLARGLYVLIREATNARNLATLLPLITKENSRRICFCTDDRTAADLLDVGSIDHMVREAIKFGIAPVDAFCMATLNTAEWFGLHDRGAIAPGRFADLMIFEDLNKPVAKMVVGSGKQVAADQKLEAPIASIAVPSNLLNSFNVDLKLIKFGIPALGEKAHVIGSLVDQLVTEDRILPIRQLHGLAQADPSHDILKMAVIERHTGRSKMGLGFIQGIGLKRGAIGGTVAHDHHNLVIIGCDDDSMMRVAQLIAKSRGGLAAVDPDGESSSFRLPVAGLMSDEPIEQVRRQYDAILAAAHRLGSPLHDPFMAMSFMALEVIPKLKLTDQGLVDVEKFAKIDLFV